MAITNTTLVETTGGAPGQKLYVDAITLDLDANPPSGGYAGFEAIVQAVIGSGRTLVGIVQNNNPGTTKARHRYDRANDKLLCLAWDGTEITSTLAANTGLELICLSY